MQFYANIGRAQNTIVAYGRALDDHLRVLAEADTPPLAAGVDVVATWIGDMLSRPNPRGAATATRQKASKAQLLEAKENLQRMLANIPLTDDGQTALDNLLKQLVNVPTPSGSTPRQIGAPATATLLPILSITKHRHDK